MIKRYAWWIFHKLEHRLEITAGERIVWRTAAGREMQCVRCIECGRRERIRPTIRQANEDRADLGLTVE
jgi:hypothetical protein